MKLASASAAFVSLLLAVTASTTPPPQVNEWIQRPGTNHLYIALDNKGEGKNWKDARNKADGLKVCDSKAHLASIKSKGEDDFIIENVIGDSNENFWLGATKRPCDDCGPGDGYGNGWKWITGGDIPDNQNRSDSQTSGKDEKGRYENWHDPFEPNNAEGDVNPEDCLEFKGFEIEPVKAWNDVDCNVRHRFSIVEATVPTIHIGTCDTKVVDIVHADFKTSTCSYEFQDAYDDCVEDSNTRGQLNKCIAAAIKKLPSGDRGKVMKVIKHGCD